MMRYSLVLAVLAVLATRMGAENRHRRTKDMHVVAHHLFFFSVNSIIIILLFLSKYNTQQYAATRGPIASEFNHC
ncbi:hypothetical protein BDZ91DRAFT_728015 [Kalaharituber pfeilii]|nr:hypothetical protein BDZ91DRAFT_728015 [Kalaharituber pfeilii]